MTYKLTLFLFVISQIVFSQQYDTVVLEKENIDSNNDVYKTGNAYIFEYEIIKDGVKHKLKKNTGMFAGRDFQLVPIETDSVDVDKIHLIVQPVTDSERSNAYQTQITYLQEPIYNSFHSTGIVENENNIWMHPIRIGFFNALETAPFPFIQTPLQIGKEWNDAMKIGQAWRDEMWGMWEGSLILDYTYRITERKTVTTKFGELECYVIESSAISTTGETKLKSYFSETYGFVRFEYELLNNLKVNFWLVEYKTGVEFNDMRTFYQTKSYLKR